MMRSAMTKMMPALWRSRLPAVATVRSFSSPAAVAGSRNNRTAPSTAKNKYDLKALTAENPHIDVVHYTHKNRTWTLNHVQFYSEAMAIGIVELGFQPGDIVLSWLPEHFSEQVCIY
jgi:hypothetical protein